MIRSIDIRNFRCYPHLNIEVPARLNVIVGDNGAGKTSLLEAIFLALCATSQIALRYRQERGLEGSFNGTARRIEEAIFADLFTGRDSQSPIVVSLDGDGDDRRSVVISRGPGGSILPLGESPDRAVSTLPIRFAWTAANGSVYEAAPTIASGTLAFPETGEDLPNFFLVPANSIVTSVEIAQRFSDLGRIGRREEFTQFVTSEYPWIEALSVEALAGAPVVFAKVRGQVPVPLASVSSGINRLVSYLLCMATREQSVVLIDEIEVGTHYSHHQAIWAGLIRFMRSYDSQLFVTTHSQECLKALAVAAGEDVEDIALWRVERCDGHSMVKQFSGKQFVAGIEYGQEVR